MRPVLTILVLLIFAGCLKHKEKAIITVNGQEQILTDKIWLSHEHLLVDFIGADSIDPAQWNRDSIIKALAPALSQLKEHGVTYFVDATPQYLGRDAELLQKISNHTGLHILTNTGYYGARKNKYIPRSVWSLSPEEMAANWIKEFEYGIDNSSVKPGFIKISVDNSSPLDSIHQKIVKASALTHLETGLVIASHTGEADALWPQLQILKDYDVSPENFIWVHAQNEQDFDNYLKAATEGCWISLDGMGWGMEGYVERLQFARQNNILDHILISHDAGWYDPQKDVQKIQPYTPIFEELIPKLRSNGFTESDVRQLLTINPAKAYYIKN